MLVSFYPVVETGNYSKVFLELIQKSKQYRYLFSEFSKEKGKKIKFSFYMSEDETILKVHVSCFIDHELIRLANKFSKESFSFPRGFLFLIDLNSEEIIGKGFFYPKFSNDDRNTIIDSSEFVDVDNMTFFVKYSGSLGIITIFKHPKLQKICWTVSSKNSGDSSKDTYCHKIQQMMKKFISNSTISDIFKKEKIVSFSFEAMGLDNMHGYASNEGYVVTCAMTETSFLNPSDLYSLCEKYKLSTDKPLSISGKNVASFLREINQYRDIMHVTLFENILRKLDYEYDMTLHRSLVKSEIMEGFVITLIKGNKEKKILKYKFFFYVCVTMFLRPKLMKEKEHKIRKESSVAYIIREWTTSSDPRIITFINNVLSTFDFRNSNGNWIEVAENVYNALFFDKIHSSLCESYFGKIDDVLNHNEVCKHPISISAVIIIILGPIGFGKSTMGNWLANHLPSSVHIDGDLFLPRNIVENLKKDRNWVTISHIVSAIMKKKIVIVSCGGGALCSNDCFLPKVLSSLFINAKLVLLHPDDMNSYDDKIRLEKVIKDRKMRGENWNKDTSTFLDICKRNKKFVDILMPYAKEVHVYSEILDPDESIEFDLSSFMNEEEIIKSQPDVDLLNYGSIWQFFYINDVFSIRKSLSENKKNSEWKKILSKVLEPRLLHRTIQFSEEYTLKEYPTEIIKSSTEVASELIFAYDKNTKEGVCCFVKLLDSPSSHLTVWTGKYKAHSMNEFAIAVFNKTYIAENVVLTNNEIVPQVLFSIELFPISICAGIVGPMLE